MYTFPGLPTTPDTHQSGAVGLVTVDSEGNLDTDDGALQTTVDALSTSVGASGNPASETGSVYARVAHVKEVADTAATDVGAVQSEVTTLSDSVGTNSDTASDTGSAFARIARVKEVADTTAATVQRVLADAATENVLSATVGTLSDSVGASDDAADEAGSVYARVAQVQEAIDDAAAIAAAGQAQAFRIIVETAVGTTDNADPNNAQFDTVTKKLTGGTTEERIAKLAELATTLPEPGQPIFGADGQLVNANEEEFLGIRSAATGSTVGAEGERDVYLFRALYGDGEGGKGADSEAPTPQSIVGRIESVEGGKLDKLEALPDTVVAAGDYRVVVAVDAPGPGDKTQLRTIDLGALAGVDKRVDQLSIDLDRGIAMSAALSALPSVVPNAGKYNLSIGFGDHGGESAFAFGFTARLGEATHFNIGGATASGNSGTTRAGVNWTW